MTRPDPRLLLKAGLLRFVPEGARVWVGDQSITVNRHGDAVASSDWVDLSAPETRDGLDARLDLLPWALQALGWNRIPLVTPAWIDVGGAVYPADHFGDLSGLTPSQAWRAVVVSVLSSRGES